MLDSFKILKKRLLRKDSEGTHWNRVMGCCYKSSLLVYSMVYSWNNSSTFLQLSLPLYLYCSHGKFNLWLASRCILEKSRELHTKRETENWNSASDLCFPVSRKSDIAKVIKLNCSKSDGDLCKRVSAIKGSSTENALLKSGCLIWFSLFNFSVTTLPDGIQATLVIAELPRFRKKRSGKNQERSSSIQDSAGINYCSVSLPS